MGEEKTPDIPVGPDDSTANYALQGLALDDLATGSSSAKGCLVVSRDFNG
jgi:hypothetical protein